MKFPFRILCWGGVGDTLRNISLIPHQQIYRTFGYRCPVVYKDFTGIDLFGTVPASPFFGQLVERCPSLVWGGQIFEHRSFGQLANRSLREALKLLNGGKPRYYSFELRLSETERAQLPLKVGFTVGVQTHFTGMPTKAWGLENWQSFVAKLLAEHPDIQILLIDKDDPVAAVSDDSRVQTTLGLNICQSIHAVQQLDLLVSIDSWTKYVAAWSNVPQVLVIPDQRSDYPGLHPAKLAREELAGIRGEPSVDVIGLEGEGRKARYTLPRMVDLKPETLLRRTSEMIAQLRT